MKKEDLGHAYRAWKTWTRDGFGGCSDVDARYFDAEFGRVGLRLDRQVSILEIGFGNGAFAAWATSHACAYIGTELDDVLVERARFKGFSAFPATLDLESITGGRRFDCVVAFDVLEHLSLADCEALLMSMSRCLSDEGVFVARFPSGDSPFSRSIQHGDMTHRTVIGGGIIQQLATKARLEVVQMRPPAFPLTGLGLRTMFRRLPVAVVRGVVGRLVNFGFHDNQPKVMTANMLVVMRRLRDGDLKR